jgi:hypothetical protein
LLSGRKVHVSATLPGSSTNFADGVESPASVQVVESSAMGSIVERAPRSIG